MPSILRGNYGSVAQVYRITKGMLNGAPSYNWVPVSTIVDDTLNIAGRLSCRLELGWLKPGAQAPDPVEAGVVPPRIGTLFFDLLSNGNVPLLAKDRLQFISGPINGIFEIRMIPQPAQDAIGIATHAEVQAVEVSITTLGVFPGVEVS